MNELLGVNMPGLLNLVRDWDGFEASCLYEFCGLAVTQHGNHVTATLQRRSQRENGRGVAAAALTYYRKDAFSVGSLLHIEHAVDLASRNLATSRASDINLGWGEPMRHVRSYPKSRHGVIAAAALQGHRRSSRISLLLNCR